MGREAKIKKDRMCRVCGKDFLSLSAPQIEMHSFACSFEKRTGIEIINMAEKLKPVEDESLIVIP